jgi:hypothetical protein
MLDLEFLGKPPLARITNIGACFFNPLTGEIGDQFYMCVNWAEESDQSLPVDVSTVKWWMEQQEDARKELLSSDRVTLALALSKFKEFVNKNTNAFKVELWGNGDDCDCVIFEAAYKSAKMEHPWKFWGTRDVRTIVSTVKLLHNTEVNKITPFEGVPHHALHDAIHQAKYVSLGFQMLQMGTVE